MRAVETAVAGLWSEEEDILASWNNSRADRWRKQLG